MKLRHLKYIIRLLKTVLWDIRYFFEFGLKNRVTADSYQLHVALKLHPKYMREGNAARYILSVAERFCKGKGVDVGAGVWPVFEARPVEDNANENAYAINEVDGSLDYVFSSHLLEHLDKPYDAILEWVRVIKSGGVIFIYLPHPACKMWDKNIFSHHVWNPSPSDIAELVGRFSELEVIEQDGRPDCYLSHYIVCKKR